MSAKQWQNGNKNQETEYFHFSKILCVKYVRIRRFSGPYFRAFVQNTERFGVSLHIQSKCGKMRTRKTSNTYSFHAVIMSKRCIKYHQIRNSFFAVFPRFGLNTDICAVIFSESPLSLRVWEKKKTKTTHESIFQPMNFQNRSSATKYQPSSNLSIESSFRSS